MTRLAYQELLALADGTYTTVERQAEVPDGRVVGQNLGFTAYFPLEGVTIPRGGFWHWEPVAAGEAQRIRVLTDAEVKALSKRGVIQTNATMSADPITDVSLIDLQTADAPILQVPSERVLAEVEA